MSRISSRIAIALTLLLASLWWAVGPPSTAHARSVRQGPCPEINLQNLIDQAPRGGTISLQGILCAPVITYGPIVVRTNLTIDMAGASVIPAEPFVISGRGVTLENVAMSRVLGGVAIDNQGTLTVTNSTFSGVGTAIDNQGTLTVTNSTFSGNAATAIDNQGTLTVTSSTFSGNTGTSGGAIENQGRLSVTNSTFSANTGSSGGAIDNKAGTVTLANTILTGSSGGNTCGGVITGIIDAGGNLSDDGSCAFTAPSSTNNSPTLDSTLGPLQSNGGPTRTIALLPGSPAMDVAPAATCPSTDQRGFLRPDPGETTCDSGALESGSEAGHTIPTGCSESALQNTINAVGYGGTVLFDQDCTITLAGTITLGLTVTIDGNGHKVTLSGGGSAQVFVVKPVVTATLDGLTITHGSNSSSVGVTADGGAINNQGTLNVSNSTVSGNSSITFGGAIYNQGTLNVSNSTFSGNVAPQGGAIYNAGRGVLTVMNSTFSGNNAGSVSGIFNEGSSSAATLANTILAESVGNECEAVTDLGGNLSDDFSCGFTQSSSTNRATGLNLGPLADNGGPTQTIALLPGSAALDVAPAASCPDTDQRGFPRPGTGETSCDSGAFESNPPSTIGITPSGAPQWSSGLSLTVNGTEFSTGSVVQLDGTALTTRFVSSTQLTADVPAALTTTTYAAHTAQVTVVDHDGADALTSNPQLLYITPLGASLLSPPSAATGLNPSATSASPYGSPAYPGSVTVSASGSGSVAAAMYISRPTTTPIFADSSFPFDVYVAPGNTFSYVNIVVCGINDFLGIQVVWWNGTAWAPVSSEQTGLPLLGCATVYVDKTTSPNLSQLGGTPFGVASAPMVSVADAQSVQYGGPLKSFQVSATDVVAGAPLTLTASGLPAGLSFTDNGNGTGTVSGTDSAPVGSYTASFTANDGHYDSQAGTVRITVSPAPLTVTASSPSMTYGGTVPAITPSYSGLANGNTAPATAPTCGTTASGSSPAGTYPTTCAGAADPNYSISYVAGTLTINPATLTITANDQQMTYGGTRPALTWAATFVNGDTAASLTTAPGCGTVAASSPSGGYDITCTGAVDPNYTIGYAKGTLTINSAPLTISASSPAVAYSGTVPAITPGYSGFVNGDGAASLTTPPTCSSTAPSGGAVGSYTTSCAGAVDANYAPIGYVAGTLTINQASQVISFGPLPDHLLGDAPFTVSATGGGSGDPVTFSAGPAGVCAASGSSAQTITLVGAGACTVTATQAGNANYQAAAPVARAFTVAYPPLYLALAVTTSPAGPVTTGSAVKTSFTLGNHTAATQAVNGKVTLTYTGSKGSLSLPVPFALTLKAGQTLSQSAGFTVTKAFPRGTYTLSVSAKDGSGDAASRSVALTIV